MRRRSRHPVSCGERPSCSCLQTRHAMHPPYSRHTRRHAETLDLVRACCHGLWRQTQCTKYQSLRCAIAKAASLLRYSADRRHAAVPSLACRALHALHTRRLNSLKRNHEQLILLFAPTYGGGDQNDGAGEARFVRTARSYLATITRHDGHVHMVCLCCVPARLRNASW